MTHLQDLQFVFLYFTVVSITHEDAFLYAWFLRHVPALYLSTLEMLWGKKIFF